MERNNPKKVEGINKRSQEKIRTEKIKNRNLGLEGLLLGDYGAGLEKKDKRVGGGYQRGKRRFCLDCTDIGNCSGWGSCEYKNEIFGVD